MKPVSASVMLMALVVFPGYAANMPEAPSYLGEIRRGADGRLIAVPPAAPEEAALPAAPPVQGKTSQVAHPTPKADVRSSAPAAAPRTIRVGPQQQVRNLSVAATLAQDGDTIEVEPGDYVADIAIWKQDNLTIRGVGAARPRLIAAGASAEGKAIWVVRGGRIAVENLEFRGARVPDRNGAGIRFERGYLTVRNCKFEDNENGILSAGGSNMYLDIENSEFGHNGAGDGRSHNIYIGEITRLRVTGSYFHHARKGHLLKSRAAENHVFYNRLSDEIDGHASYELEFPNGGIAYVIGNIIEQGSQTENSNIISYGAEGLLNRPNSLYLLNNTIVDNRPSNGNVLAVVHRIPKLLIMNNLLVTRRKFEIAQDAQISNNPNVDWQPFALAARYDFRLKSNADVAGKYVRPPASNDVSLIPQREYVHPAGSRPLSGGTRHPGAMQSLSP